MKMYEVPVCFNDSEQKIFSFRYPAEAEGFMNVILLCEECIFAGPIKEVIK